MPRKKYRTPLFSASPQAKNAMLNKKGTGPLYFQTTKHARRTNWPGGMFCLRARFISPLLVTAVIGGDKN